MNANPPNHRPLGPIFVISECDELRRLTAANLQVNNWQVREFERLESLLNAVSFNTELVMIDNDLSTGSVNRFLCTLAQRHPLPVLMMSLTEPDRQIFTSWRPGISKIVSAPFNPSTVHSHVLSAVWSHRMHRPQWAAS